MAEFPLFTNIDVNKPLGTYRVSTIDDYERETRRALVGCMQAISGYPDSTALKIGSWTTDTRPDNPVEGLFGYNTDTGCFEYYDGSGWQNLTEKLPDIYDKARKDQHGNVIDTTYATKTELANATEVMAGATANANGKKGLVPQPNAGQQGLFLRGDGTWNSPANTTYTTGTAAQLTAGTDSTGQVWGANVLKSFVSSSVSNAFGGLVIKTGTMATETGTFTETKTYSFGGGGFPNNCYAVWLADGSDGTVIRKTRTNFTVRGTDYQGSGDNQPYYFDYGGKWMAIGN